MLVIYDNLLAEFTLNERPSSHVDIRICYLRTTLHVYMPMSIIKCKYTYRETTTEFVHDRL